MRYLLTALFLLPIYCFSQSFTHFKWDGDDVTFSSVEMKVEDEKAKKVVFNGYKDGTIKIKYNSSDPSSALIDIKLSGYFDMSSGSVSSFSIKTDEKWHRIEYTVDDAEDKLCFISLNFRIGETKPAFIVVSTNSNYRVKTSKQLVFTLKGFD